MTNREIIRDIFSRFQNLNLLTLIGNLKCRRVAIDEFYGLNNMCPLAHGFNGQCNKKCTFVEDTAREAFGPKWQEFTTLWDRQIAPTFNRQRRAEITFPILEEELESIFAERLADADAVQEVIRPRKRLRKMASLRTN